MSGGAFDYWQFHIEHIADKIEQVIKDNDYVQEGDYKYSDEVIAEFKNAVNQLRKAFVYAQRVDWLLEGDDDEKDFLKRLKDELSSLTLL